MSGGNTLFPGIVDRVHNEIATLSRAQGNNYPRGVMVAAPPDRKYSVWEGGAILASLPSFNHSWITKPEYDEADPYLYCVHSSCLGAALYDYNQYCVEPSYGVMEPSYGVMEPSYGVMKPPPRKYEPMKQAFHFSPNSPWERRVFNGLSPDARVELGNVGAGGGGEG
jgi:hypothetical protein